MKLKILFGIIILSQVIGFSCSTKNKTEETKPNILFLFTDDQRYETIGALGNKEIKTPNLDKLVTNGVTFNNAYILGAPHAAVCSPSRAMLMTGRHYFNIPGNVHTQWAYPNEERGKCDLLTFPEHFRANGYTTFATGKQHNGRDWIERGFTKGKSLFLGGMSTHFGLAVSDFDSINGWSKPYKNKEKYSSELFADAAIEFLGSEKHAQPFLMYISFTAPHDPRTAPDNFHAMYTEENVSLPVNFMPGHPFPIANMKIRDELLASFPRTEKETKQQIGDYYAMITATDHHIGRILEALEKSGEKNNTIIVFAGDNGLAVGQHGLMGKQSVYEHSVKIPFVFCGKGIPKGEKREALVYLHDLFPTLCDLSGLDIPESIQTKNIAPLIRDKDLSVRESMHFAYHSYKSDKYKNEPQLGAHRAVRKGDYKLIISKMGSVTHKQLFNLKDDPFELNNLIDDTGLQSILVDLETELKRLINETNDPADLEADDFGLYSE
jgi:arylsulfatase A-like enzyme